MSNSWMDQINKSKKFKEKSVTHGRKVYSLYEDNRDANAVWIKKANFFYANVNILKESLFNSLPKADVSRMQKGNFLADDARVAAIIVERGLNYEMKCAPNFEEAIKSAILDRLVPGMGQVWIKFDIDQEEQTLEVEGGEPTTSKVPVQGTERISVEHVHWEDFFYQPCRLWSKCGWVGRKLYFTKEELIERWGEDAVSKVGDCTKKSDTDLDPAEIDEGKYVVYEIWDKKSKQVIFTGAGEEVLEKQDDPYQLKDFYPCPEPLMANLTTNKFLPITDYHIAEDQYSVLNQLYARINLIIKAVKVAGMYNSESMDIQRMLTSEENVLIPVDSWAMMAENGGVSANIEWYPVEKIVTVLQTLQAQFEAAKAMLYEITGMSDIIRGATNQYETKGAQEIKAQFASVRMNGYQRNVAIFVRDVMRIMSELMCQLYSIEKLKKIVGELAPPDMEHAEAAVGILRDDVLSMYNVDIQANSLTQADWALEKGQRMEVVQTLGSMLQATVGMAAQAPQIVPLAVQMIKFAIAGFKGASEFEGYVDQILDDMLQEQQKAKTDPQPPKPSPEEQKAQGEMQKMQMQGQMDQQRFEMEQQGKQADMAMKQQEQQQNMSMEERKMGMELEMKQAELVHKTRMYELEIQMKLLELQLKEKESQISLLTKEATAQQGLDHADQKNRQSLEQQKAQAKLKPDPAKKDK